MGRFFKILVIISLFVGIAVASSLIVVYFVFRGEEVVVPDLVGSDVITALEAVSQRGLNLKIGGREFSSRFPKDTIVSQEPEARQAVRKGRDVRIVLSLGNRQITVPTLLGESYRQAEIVLRQDGLAAGKIARVYDGQVGKDLVVAQTPPPQTVAGGGTTVNLLVSLGARPARYVTPDLTGGTVERAQAALEPFEIQIQISGSEVDPGVPAGTIIRQQPLQGYPIAAGDALRVVVSR